MPVYELEKQQVKLASINPRAELHGGNMVPAMDLKFEQAADNGVLANFASDLRSMLYKRPDSQEDMIDPERLSVLKYPKMSGFKWELDGTGYELTIHYGINEKSHIVLTEVQIDGFKIQPMEGGTVLVAWRAIVHPEENVVGKLYSLIQQNVEISLKAPEPTTVQQLFNEEKAA